MTNDQLQQGLILVARALVALEDQRVEYMVDEYLESYRRCPVCNTEDGHEEWCAILAVKRWLEGVEGKRADD